MSELFAVVGDDSDVEVADEDEYASTAVWRGIVLVGSYDNRFYAINGATGSERWSFNAGGRISGAASSGSTLPPGNA